MAEIYQVPVLKQHLNQTVTVPGSKSETNRALLLSCLGKGECTLQGVQFSDDSRHFLECLRSLGFELDIREDKKTVCLNGCEGKIPVTEGEIHVGSAGTAARFLTAMLAFSHGVYTINCSDQMAGRPMEELFRALEDMGADFEYLGERYHLPVRVTGIFSQMGAFADQVTGSETQKGMEDTDPVRSMKIRLDISRSTQYLSALMLTASMLGQVLEVEITSDKKTGSYIEITRRMLKEFGVRTEYEDGIYLIHGEDVPQVQAGDPGKAVLAASRKQTPCEAVYCIEPDVSGACYFYAAAAITGGTVTVLGVHPGLMQGDMRFLKVLETMGCTLEDTKEGIRLTGPSGKLSGIDLQMNDFSDQALTLAAIAPFASGPVTIRGIAHIRHQECDRIHAMVTNLEALGVRVVEREDGVTIYPGTAGNGQDGTNLSGADPKYRKNVETNRPQIHGARIKTFGDHRVAMAFTLPGLLIPGVVIEDPMCCRKTFEEYFDLWDEILQTGQ